MPCAGCCGGRCCTAAELNYLVKLLSHPIVRPCLHLSPLLIHLEEGTSSVQGVLHAKTRCLVQIGIQAPQAGHTRTSVSLLHSAYMHIELWLVKPPAAASAGQIYLPAAMLSSHCPLMASLSCSNASLYCPPARCAAAPGS